MNVFEGVWYDFNIRAFRFYGQWPFDSAIHNRRRRTFIFCLIFTITLPKLIKLYESLGDVDKTLLCLPVLLLHAAAYTKLFFWSTSTPQMKLLMEHVQRDWDMIKSTNDQALLREYAERGKKHRLLYVISTFGLFYSYLVSPVVPKIMDLVVPLNESRPKIFLYQAEYFVDQDKYYIPILIHAYMTVPVAMGIIIFYDNMMGLYIHHSCGMMGIVSRHLQHLHTSLPEDEKDDGFNEPNEFIKIEKRIAYSAKVHNNTIEFVEEVQTYGSNALFIIIGINCILITLTGVLVVMKLDVDKTEALTNLAFSFGCIFHLYYISMQGDFLIEESAKIFIDAYSSEWYNFPPCLQKLLIPIMVRSKRPCFISAGGIYVMSMENFSNVLRSSMSFFTVLNSTR